MQAIDIRRYRFDFDLTLAVLFASPDGRVYHRFGGRTAKDPGAYLTMPGLESVMRATLVEHEQQRQARAPGTPARPARTIYDIPAFAKKVERDGKRPACIHCHTIHDAQIRDRAARGTFQRDSIWVWPAPERVGLSMDPVDQAVVRRVAKDSPAAAASLRVGDRLIKVGGARVLTVPDLQAVLDDFPFAGGELALEYRRDEKVHRTVLRLAAGFKQTDPLTYSWRPYKWALRPAPGFGGRMLPAGEKRRLGLDPEGWAFRVSYIVDWGETPEQGRENRRRGLRKGDIVTSYAGKDDFETMDHFHAWTRLTRAKGEKVAIQVLRRGTRHRIEVTLQ